MGQNRIYSPIIMKKKKIMRISAGRQQFYMEKKNTYVYFFTKNVQPNKQKKN